MDISDTLAPTSDQLDAVDLLAGERTFTVKSVARLSGEQPVNIFLAEFDRPWRPGKSMRRVLVACWGKDASQYVGRRLTLWCDPTVKFGGAEVGGVRIRSMSHLDKAKSVPLLVTRGKSAMYKVQPLAEDAPNGTDVPLAQRIDQAITAFANGGITRDQLQARVGKPAIDWTAQDLADLQALFESLKRRETTKEQAFPSQPEQPADALPIPGPEDYDPTSESGWNGGDQ